MTPLVELGAATGDALWFMATSVVAGLRHIWHSVWHFVATEPFEAGLLGALLVTVYGFVALAERRAAHAEQNGGPPMT